MGVREKRRGWLEARGRRCDESRGMKRERETERMANERESESVAESREGASRGTSFRVHDGVDALEARRACGGSFSSRSYVDRKTFHITWPLDAQRAIVGEGSQGGFARPNATPRSVFLSSFEKSRVRESPTFVQLRRSSLSISLLRWNIPDDRKREKSSRNDLSRDTYTHIQCSGEKKSMDPLRSADFVGA